VTVHPPHDHDERIAVLFGKNEQANDRYREQRLSFAGGAVPVDVVVRCYDDALAFRYEVAATPERRTLRITAEATTFGLAGDPLLRAQLLPHFRTSHEHEVKALRLTAIPAGQLLDVPLTGGEGAGPFFAITEAALLRYAGMSLRRDTASTRLVAAFAPRDDGAIVERPLPLVTPWRVVLFGSNAGALLASDTLYCLNEPAAFDQGDAAVKDPNDLLVEERAIEGATSLRVPVGAGGGFVARFRR
jgi:alpha-glucosidase